MGCDTQYKYDKSLVNKLHKFQHKSGSISRSLRNKTEGEIQLHVEKCIAVYIFLYERKIWTLIRADRRKIETKETKL